MMKIASLKAKITRIMKAEQFQRTESSPSRIKGLKNISAGFEFRRTLDHYLFWYWGNMGYRGRPGEEGNPYTERLYERLKELGLSEFIELVEVYLIGQKVKAIRLIGDEGK